MDQFSKDFYVYFEPTKEVSNIKDQEDDDKHNTNALRTFRRVADGLSLVFSRRRNVCVAVYVVLDQRSPRIHTAWEWIEYDLFFMYTSSCTDLRGRSSRGFY